MSYAQPEARLTRDCSAAKPAATLRIADVADTAHSAHHYRVPEVNRLKAKKFHLRADISRDTTHHPAPCVLPPGFAISLMIGASLLIWSVVAGVVSLAL